MAEGPVAVVTGGSSGIGRATAEHLVSNGYRVLICARGADRLEETARELGPDRVAWHACDVGDERAADEAIASRSRGSAAWTGSSAPRACSGRSRRSPS